MGHVGSYGYLVTEYGRGRFTRLIFSQGGNGVPLGLLEDWIRQGDDSAVSSWVMWGPTVTCWLSTGRGRFTCLILGHGVSYGTW